MLSASRAFRAGPAVLGSAKIFPGARNGTVSRATSSATIAQLTEITISAPSTAARWLSAIGISLRSPCRSGSQPRTGRPARTRSRAISEPAAPSPKTAKTFPVLLRLYSAARWRLLHVLAGVRPDALPRLVDRDQALLARDPVVGNRGVLADQREPGLERFDRLEHPSPHPDDRDVGLTEVLLGTIDDRAHRFLRRDVLLLKAFDPGPAPTLHRRTILLPAILGVAQREPVFIQIDARLDVEAASQLGFVDRGPVLAVKNVEEHRVLVVHRDEDLRVGRLIGIERRRDERRARYDEQRDADVFVLVRILVRRSDRSIAKTVRRILRFQSRREIARDGESLLPIARAPAMQVPGVSRIDAPFDGL